MEHALMTLSFKALLTAAGLLVTLASSQAADLELRIGFLRGPSDLSLVHENGTLEKALAPLGVKVRWLGPFPAAAPA